MKSIYSPQLIASAKELLNNEAFHYLLKEHLKNLQDYVMGADDPGDVIKAHSEHASIVAFAEYIQLLGEDTVKKEQERYG